jgi:hypothetical protein
MLREIRRDGFVTFFTAVVLIQGIHVVEHIIQLFQVYVLRVPEDDALGLLGYVFEFQGTEEWLHLGFNSVYMLSLFVLTGALLGRAARWIPAAAVGAFLVGAVGLETWHVVEHGVITKNIVMNQGCPCPGILDARLGVSDTVLHFGYNLVAYAGTVVPYWFLIRRRPTTPEAALMQVPDGETVRSAA